MGKRIGTISRPQRAAGWLRPLTPDGMKVYEDMKGYTQIFPTPYLLPGICSPPLNMRRPRAGPNGLTVTPTVPAMPKQFKTLTCVQIPGLANNLFYVILPYTYTTCYLLSVT